MRVLLVRPPYGNGLGLGQIVFSEPLGLECVAASLMREGHETRIVDLQVDAKGLRKESSFLPEFVGIQCNFTVERNRTLEVAKWVKHHLDPTFIVIGGHDASLEPEFFQRDFIDAVAIGNGELNATALVQTVADGGNLKQVPGIFFRGVGGSWVRTEATRSKVDMDGLPFPARELVRANRKSYRFVPLETARGCPFRCHFCSVWKFHEKAFSKKSVDRVMKELLTIQEKRIFITDDLFLLNAKVDEGIAVELKRSGIEKEFTFQTRADVICANPHVLELWRDNGRAAVFVGMEKIDDAGLESVNKGTQVLQNEEALRILKKLKINFLCNFIVDPQWEKAQFEALREYIRRNQLPNVSFTVLTPLPGTETWNQVKDKLVSANYDEFDAQHAVLPTILPKTEFYREYSGLWKTVKRHRWQGLDLSKGWLWVWLKLVVALVRGTFDFVHFKRSFRAYTRLASWRVYFKT